MYEQTEHCRDQRATQNRTFFSLLHLSIDFWLIWALSKVFHFFLTEVGRLDVISFAMRTKNVADFTKDLADLVEAGFLKRKVWKMNFQNCLLNLFKLFGYLENIHFWPFMWSCALRVTALPFQFLDAGEVVHFANLCGRGLLDCYRSRSYDKLCLHASSLVCVMKFHCQRGVAPRADLAKFVWGALFGKRFFSLLSFVLRIRSISWTLVFFWKGTAKKVFKFLNPQQDVKRKEAWEAAKGMLKEPLRSKIIASLIHFDPMALTVQYHATCVVTQCLQRVLLCRKDLIDFTLSDAYSVMC